MNFPEVLNFALLAFSSLFVIIDPIATVPAFLAMTSHDTPEQRIRMARLACMVATGVLLVFSGTGRLIFSFLGITLPAFQLAGSMVLLMVAYDMLRARRSEVQETKAETSAGAEKEDIAVTPLAIPMLAGPGAITTAILLRNQAEGSLGKQIALYLCIAVVCGISYLILRISAKGAKWLNPIAMRIATRIMGLLLAAVAFQFMLNALKDQKVGIL
jgi:multiple antibiotic resistance protein